MAIWCKHVERLELRKFFLNFLGGCVFTSHARYKDEILVFLILNMHVRNKKYGNFVFMSHLARKYATQK